MFIQSLSMMTTLRTSKAVVRDEISKRLPLLTAEEKQRQSKTVANKLFNLPAFKQSKRVSVFLSLDTEVDTEPIVRKIFEEGKQCFVPRYSKTAMQMVKLHSMEDWEKLPVTAWNIKQPSLKEARESAVETGGLDLIIVPGVGFTAKGLRLGHGGGYYDKFLQSLIDSQEVKPATIAVAFKEQVLEDIPVESTDVVIDHVLYDNE